MIVPRYLALCPIFECVPNARTFLWVTLWWPMAVHRLTEFWITKFNSHMHPLCVPSNRYKAARMCFHRIHITGTSEGTTIPSVKWQEGQCPPPPTRYFRLLYCLIDYRHNFLIKTIRRVFSRWYDPHPQSRTPFCEVVKYVRK